MEFGFEVMILILVLPRAEVDMPFLTFIDRDVIVMGRALWGSGIAQWVEYYGTVG